MTTPTKAQIEALLGTLEGETRMPRWCLQPATESELAASILAHRPGVTPVYDEQGELLGMRGIGLLPDR